MLRTALRLGVLPLLAILVICDSASGPDLVMRGLSLWLSALLVVPLMLFSYWRLKADSPTGAVPKWARLGAPFVWLLSVIIIVSVTQTDWPLHLSFRASKPQLEQLIANARAKKPILVPLSIGQFSVTRVKSYDEETVLFLNGATRGEGPLLRVPTPGYARKYQAAFIQNGENIALGDNWYFHSGAD